MKPEHVKEDRKRKAHRLYIRDVYEIYNDPERSDSITDYKEMMEDLFEVKKRHCVMIQSYEKMLIANYDKLWQIFHSKPEVRPFFSLNYTFFAHVIDIFLIGVSQGVE